MASIPQIDHNSNMTRKLKPDNQGNEDSAIAHCLADLPDDVLYVILLNLDIRSLGSICRTCRRMRNLSEKDFLWVRHGAPRTLVQESRWCNKKEKIVSHHTECSQKEKVRRSYNWKNHDFRSVIIARNRIKQMPWIQYDQMGLWVSTEQHIKCYPTTWSRRPRHDVHTLTGAKHDISHFVVKDESVVAGCSDGSVLMWNKTSKTPQFSHKVHDSNIHKVDVCGNLVFTGSVDNTVRVVDMSRDTEDRIVAVFDTDDRVWSVVVSPDGRQCVGGTAARSSDITPVIVWDLERMTKLCNLGTEHKRGAGVFDLKFDSPHTLLSCGYDTILRMWDMRTQTCVCEWEEPFDYAVYCVDSDNNTSIFTGTARSSMTRLWDKRKPEPVSMFHPPGRMRDSPVYSVAHNTSCLFVALDLSVHMLDFSKY